MAASSTTTVAGSGQALVWSDGTITNRIETSLSEEDAIRMATSLE